MKKIKIGVMGCASIAKRMVIPAILDMDEFELIAIASRSPEKVVEFSKQFDCEAIIGYDELLKRQDIDAIYMPLPTGLHLEWGLKAIEVGKHVLMEKSLALSLEEAVKLVQLATDNKIIIKENYMFEYHPQQEVIKNLIEQGLGEIRVFKSYFGFPPLEPNNFRYIKNLGGGALMDAGGYVLKSIKVFFPDKKVKILSSNLGFDEKGIDIHGSCMTNIYDEKTNITGFLSFGFDNFYQCGIEVWGSKGKLTTNRTFTAGPGFVPMVRMETASGVREIPLPEGNHFKNLLKSFYWAILEDNFEKETIQIIQQAALQAEFIKNSNYSI